MAISIIIGEDDDKTNTIYANQMMKTSFPATIFVEKISR